MNILETITGLKWKIFAGLGAAALVGALFFLALTYAENRHLTKVNGNLDARINDPVNGLVPQLAQATTNATQLKTAIDTQRKQFIEKAAADAATLADTHRRLTIAQTGSAVARKQSAAVLAAPNDLIAVDAAVMETLK